MYFAETGSEPVETSIPSYLNKEVSLQVITSTAECFRFALQEIRRNNLTGDVENYNGYRLKWQSSDSKGTNSTIYIWSDGNFEPQFRDVFASGN